MIRLTITAFYGTVAAIALITTADLSFALEPGDFGQTLRGATIGAPLAAPPPPGLYGIMESFVGSVGKGTGQNFGTTVAVPLWAPALFWSTGYQFLGANLSMGVVQPFYFTGAYPTTGATLGGNGSGPPFGGAIWSETVANTLFTPLLLQWTLGKGWFTAAGLTLIAPDGSTYNGTLNPDYFTYEPRFSLAYLSEDWHLTANFKYDINTASTGHTGGYQLVANSPPVSLNPALASQVASFGNGYRSGQLMFLDLAATHIFGKWELGPIGFLKWQTTIDSPGSGFNCARVAAILGPTLGCGRATDYSLGGLVGYNFGPVDLQVWATDSVYDRDDFRGWAIYTRLTFKIWSPDVPPLSKPMVAKARSAK